MLLKILGNLKEPTDNILTILNALDWICRILQWIFENLF